MTVLQPGPRAVPGWEPPRLASDQTSVFHYTSAAGLLGAIQSGTLWATEAAGMNDTSESELGWQALDSWIALSPPTFARALLWKILREMTDHGFRPPPPYVLCASLANDDANQWRLYGDRGHGYAIELDANAPLAVSSADRPGEAEIVVSHSTFGTATRGRDHAATYPWTPVSYTDTEIAVLARSILDYAHVLRERVVRAPAPIADSGLRTTEEVALGMALYRAAACVKGAGFAGEREARVLTTFLGSERHVDFHAGTYGIVRHARLKRSRSWGVSAVDGDGRTNTPVPRLPLLSVTLGPAHNGRLAAPAVEALLDRHGYNVPVRRSGVTLR